MRPAGPSGGRLAQFLLALAVGLILSDSSVVTLALPAILRDFDTSVDAVAWVLIAFNLALAVAAVGGAVLARGRAGAAFVVSMLVFVLACVACAAAPSLGVLIAARTAQGLCGAVAVAAALDLLVRSAGRARAVSLWASAGVLGAAVGPALGGLLTEGLSWQAMFALQAPVALLALLGARGAVAAAALTASAGAEAGTDAGRAAASASARSRPAIAPLIALALASAALSAALFLLVILLIEGWRQTPATAALTVSVMPVAALVAARWARGRDGLVPAIAGLLLVAGGLAALGLLSGAEWYWTVVPQLAIGVGLGLALATLIGVSIGRAGALDTVGGVASWTVAARHAGIVVGLLLLTPIFTADLDEVRAPAERAGLSRILDAPLSLPAKIEVARELNAQIRATGGQELPNLDAAFANLDIGASERAEAATLRDALYDELDRGATHAFSRSFLVAALLALLAAACAAAGALLARGRAGAPGTPSSNGSTMPSLALAVPGAGALAAALAAAYIALGGAGFGPHGVADACAPRVRPAGIERTQRIALAALDGTACKLGTSREDLIRPLLSRRRPPGVSEDELVNAFGAGVDRAEREGAVGGFAATALRLGVKAGGLLGILGFLLPD